MPGHAWAGPAPTWCPMSETLIRTDIPLRLDRLPWSRFHWLVVISLGITWVLDGLEVTIVGAVASVLERADTLALTSSQIGIAGSAYLAGAISARPRRARRT